MAVAVWHGGQLVLVDVAIGMRRFSTYISNTIFIIPARILAVSTPLTISLSAKCSGGAFKVF